DLAAEFLEDRQFGTLRYACRGELGIVEIAARPGVGAVKQILVRPFEVEGIGQRLTHPRVLKERPAQVVAETLHAARQLVRDLLFLDQPLAQGRAVMSGGPGLRLVLEADIVLPGLEGLERDRPVAIIVVPDYVDIGAAFAHRQVGTPVIGHPSTGDRTAWGQRLDLVGTSASG